MKKITYINTNHQKTNTSIKLNEEQQLIYDTLHETIKAHLGNATPQLI